MTKVNMSVANVQTFFMIFIVFFFRTVITNSYIKERGREYKLLDDNLNVMERFFLKRAFGEVYKMQIGKLT